MGFSSHSIEEAQLSLSDTEEARAAEGFKFAITRFRFAKSESEKRNASDELNRVRGVLIIEFHYSIEQLAQLADEAR